MKTSKDLEKDLEDCVFKHVPLNPWYSLCTVFWLLKVHLEWYHLLVALFRCKIHGPLGSPSFLTFQTRHTTGPNARPFTWVGATLGINTG